jgi:adenine-specific DNA-methyltransferase
MFQLQTEIETLIRLILQEIEQDCSTDKFDTSFDLYVLLLKPSVKRYRHHLNSTEIEIDKLKLRFKYETAFLHLLTMLLNETFLTSKNILISDWPVFQAKYTFDWYTISATIKIRIVKVSLDLSQYSDRLDEVLSNLIYTTLSHTGKRYVGEYYTPATLAKHLIEISEFNPKCLLEGKDVIDPACGGGIILTKIANSVIKYAINSKLYFNDVLSLLSKRLHGFDIQPFAIVLTKTLLIYECLPLLTINSNLSVGNWFPHVMLCDPLPGIKTLRESEARFDYIIGNPPYLSAKREFLDFANEYNDILYGHPNLFQLFLWWSVLAVKPNGKVSFLIPQSILIGPYFEKLRSQLDKHTRIKSLTRILDRKGVVGDADQQMMALCLLRNDGDLGDYEDVNVRVTRNSVDVLQAKAKPIAYSRLVRRSNNTIFWVVSDNFLDYEIVEQIENTTSNLKDLKKKFKCGNGEFVWNEQKSSTRTIADPETVPLISAASIDSYQFRFPYDGSHGAAKRQYSVVTEHISKILHTYPAVLIQRTTPRKIGRRLVACTLPANFCERHEGYLIENHVIYVSSLEQDLLYGLMGWLNSDAINFIFQLRNGTAHTSVAEVNAIPVNLEMLRKIAPISKIISESPDTDFASSTADLNDLAYNLLGINQKQKQRVLEVLSRSERSY